MIEILNTIDSNKLEIYTFRFGTSNKCVQLTQEQLARIPYLFNLVNYDNKFLSIQNEDGEYVLNDLIKYEWFMAILVSITSDQLYKLFNKLSEDNNILDTLQLFGFLCIKPISLPLLKYDNLIRSNLIDTNNEVKPVDYHKANVLEARQTAAEFIIALSKNEYDLHHLHTVECIFSLINIIFDRKDIFSSRFRYHTLTVVKEYCYSYFTEEQQYKLPTGDNIVRCINIESFMYLYHDQEPLPDNFNNVFAWRGIYIPREENYINSLSTHSKSIFNSKRVHPSRRENFSDFSSSNSENLHAPRDVEISIENDHSNLPSKWFTNISINFNNIKKFFFH